MICLAIFLFIQSANTLSDCASDSCLMQNATQIWNSEECAVLYQETNCQSCRYRSISLFLQEPYLNEMSRRIQSLIVRPGCRVDKRTDGVGWSDNPVTSTFDGVHHNIYPLFYLKDAENFNCSCLPGSQTTINVAATTFIPKIIPPANTSTTSEKIPTTSELPWPEWWCARIRTVLSPHELYNVYLIQDNATDPDIFEYIRKGKLINSWFFIEKTDKDPNKCVLEICGFSPTAPEPYKHGTCEHYTGESRLAPTNIYLDDYEVSSASCSCRSTVTDNCAGETCLSQNAAKIWRVGECAELYQEENCQSCYYDSIRMSPKFPFFSLHFYQIKSLNVRAGCIVKRWTNGVLEHDEPISYVYEEAAKDIDPSYHRDSENFTCSCDVDPDEQSSENPVTEPPRTQNVMRISQTVLFGVGIASITFLVIVLIKRSMNTKSPESEVEVCDDDTSSHDELISPAQIEYSPNSQETPEPANETILQEETPCVLLSSANDTDGASLSVPKETLGEDQLKTEIMEEVKTMIEAIFASLGGQEAAPSSQEQDGEFAGVLKSFQEICSHIIERNLFSIPHKSLETPLGDGMSGVVYKGFLNDIDGLRKPVAVKKIKWPSSNPSIVQSFLREVQTFEMIENESKFIVQFLGACCHNDGLYVITAFCELGSLQNYLHREMRPQNFQTDVHDFHNLSLKSMGDDYYVIDDQKENHLKNRLSQVDLLQLMLWCEQTASGLEFLGRKRIIHVDVALRNLLLSADKIIKICDFGLSRKCSSEDYCARTLQTGYFPFNSFVPELITRNNDDDDEPRQVSLYVDVWAFGCTVWQIFMLGANLYPDIEKTGIFKGIEIRNKLLEGYRHPDPPLAPDYVCEVLKKCWAEIPQSRPRFAELKNLFQGWRMQLEESANT